MRYSQTAASRRAGCLAAGVLTVAAVVAGCGSRPASPASGRSSPAAVKHLPPRKPVVNTSAFAGHGELAFISRGVLWVLDGATGTLHPVAPPTITPLTPQFSADGRWLAFGG